VTVSRPKILVVAYGLYFLMGVAKIVIGPALPSMIENYSITLAAAGAVFTFLSLGRFIAVSLSALSLDRFGEGRILHLGVWLLGVGLLGFTFSPNWPLHLLTMFFIGLGMGFIGPSLNTLVAAASEGEKGKGLNRLHMFFSVGSLFGPALAGAILTWGSNWRLVFLPAAIAVVLPLLATRKMKGIRSNLDLESGKRDQGEEAGSISGTEGRWRKLFTSKYFYLLGAVGFLYIGIGNGIVGWANKYLGDVFSLSVFAASSVLMIYNLGMSSGRMGSSFLSERFGYKKTILGCALGSLVFVSLAVLSGGSLLSTLGFGLSGLFLAGLFPTAIAYGTDLFPEIAGTASSSLIATAFLGGTVVPFAIGAISDRFGLKGGMFTLVSLTVVLLVVASLLPSDLKNAKELSPGD